MSRKRKGGPPYADHVRAKWEKDYAAAELGDDAELANALREIGVEAGYLKPPTEGDVLNATIRVQAGRGSQADRDVLRARARGRERQGKLTFRVFP